MSNPHPDCRPEQAIGGLPSDPCCRQPGWSDCHHVTCLSRPTLESWPPGTLVPTLLNSSQSPVSSNLNSNWTPLLSETFIGSSWISQVGRQDGARVLLWSWCFCSVCFDFLCFLSCILPSPLCSFSLQCVCDWKDDFSLYLLSCSRRVYSFSA